MATTRPADTGRRASLFLRLKPLDADRLSRLAQRVPVASKTAIALFALRLGLDLLEEDPTRLFRPAEKSPRKR